MLYNVKERKYNLITNLWGTAAKGWPKAEFFCTEMKVSSGSVTVKGTCKWTGKYL